MKPLKRITEQKTNKTDSFLTTKGETYKERESIENANLLANKTLTYRIFTNKRINRKITKLESIEYAFIKANKKLNLDLSMNKRKRYYLLSYFKSVNRRLIERKIIRKQNMLSYGREKNNRALALSSSNFKENQY